MNTIRIAARAVFRNATLASAAVLLAACVTEAVKDPGAERVRADLTALQSNPDLANRAPIAMQEAEQAVHDAEIPDSDRALTAHLIYIADRKVQTAKSMAQAQYAIDQRKALSDQNDQIQLQARTREADTAKSMNVGLKSKNDELLAELADLKAKKTERGVEVTLGDVLFSTGRADLKAGSAGNLDKLVAVLSGAPDRHVLIEGHTDSLGRDDMNLMLSQKRADAVALYLTGHGVDPSRITATGKGEAYPVAGNETAAGRQMNRRVEITIQNPPQ
jgi:outer membrane protein OmpA-like peptidoglycan-associated protein